MVFQDFIANFATSPEVKAQMKEPEERVIKEKI